MQLSSLVLALMFEFSPLSLVFFSQGSSVLRHCLQSSEEELSRLQGTCLQLVANLHGKRAAEQVDSAVVRLRRQLVDRRAMPTFLQQGLY